MQVIDDKITVSDKDAKPLSTFIRGQTVVGKVAISASGASGLPDWSNPSHHYLFLQTFLASWTFPHSTGRQSGSTENVSGYWCLPGEFFVCFRLGL